MKKTILVIGIACATMMAVAQSNTAQDNSAQGTGASQREAASGMASGKRMHKPMTITKDTDVSSPGVMVRESPSKASLGKTSVAADPQAKNKGNMSGAQSNPMYQDNKNSGENPLYEGNARNATKTRSNIQNNRVAAGDVDGDGAADSAVVKSKSNITNNRVATGDVNGDGKADVSATPGSASAQMKGDFSRGHQPDRKAATSNGKTARETGSGMATGKRQHD